MTRPFLAVLPALLILTGCGLCGKVASTTESQRETIKIVEHATFVPVITEVSIPELVMQRTTRDTSSFIENPYAESRARINPDGSLYHDLKTKPQTIRDTQDVKIVYRDTSTVKEREVEKEVVNEVERKLNGWQKFRLNGFWVLLGLLGIAYRKVIFAIVQKIIALIA
ncbi:MAG: hypothetical protein IJQ79_08900 [Bacteroidales bacterium]|nr:hypothetical protein [Bacteroidales bacterium]